MMASPVKENRYLADFVALQQRAQGPHWLRELRQRAWDTFSSLGFPVQRKGNEKWKYTDVRPIASAPFISAVQAEIDADYLREIGLWRSDWPTLVFVNGLFSESLSTKPKGMRVRAGSLANLLAQDGQLLEKHLAAYASFEDDSFVALNTAFIRDGAFVHIAEGENLDLPLHLLYLTTGGEAVVSYPRTLIVAGQSSKATIIESYVSGPGKHLTDAVTELALEPGAQIEHYRVTQESSDSFHVGYLRAHQQADSAFSSTLFSQGGAIERSDVLVRLEGQGGEAHLRGLYLTKDNEHSDHYINIDHAAPHTTSRLLYKGILDGKSRAIFGGTVLVRPGAVKTDAQQTDKNLLLSKEAEADSKPSLEIYCDDVQCGHGAAAGAVSEEALFYMRSRGLDRAAATALLIKGFAGEILDTVKVAPLQAYLEQLVMSAVPAKAPAEL